MSRLIALGNGQCKRALTVSGPPLCPDLDLVQPQEYVENCKKPST